MQRIPLHIYEHAADENRFRNRSFAGAEGLEGFSGLCGEAVQVQTVVPVSAANEREPVRTLMGYGKTEGTCQMLKQSAFAAVVKGYHLIQN